MSHTALITILLCILFTDIIPRKIKAREYLEKLEDEDEDSSWYLIIHRPDRAQQPIKLLQISITFKDRIFIFKKKLVDNHVFLRSKIHWQEQQQIRNCLLHFSWSFVCWWLTLKCIMAFYYVGRFVRVWWHHLVLRLFCGADLQHFLWNLPKMDC